MCVISGLGPLTAIAAAKSTIVAGAITVSKKTKKSRSAHRVGKPKATRKNSHAIAAVSDQDTQLSCWFTMLMVISITAD
jgi:hypothetical protein